ncbi:hypothetical protein DL766_007893 [Monosporascus sp. MC13-8B]|uniref:Uncharacterized protein n=1 Tax=Monosporascus cannonballus TaxID=155416 RepID=A0ABY0H7T3_9PEZI|nr:hypothetical protein DL762_004391 [Monosporascus cannonballus]RYO95764.1 hypothetical protein DL763_003544 [Monosporascus cannonballus]RYP21619.1 hypothetical protein DL766_007893 [Monosporascus sp. MC13-8B]
MADSIQSTDAMADTAHPSDEEKHIWLSDDDGTPVPDERDGIDEKLALSFDEDVDPHFTKDTIDDVSLTGDGAADPWGKRGKPLPVSAIFIHAGAGYHSIANEHIHLRACSEAARAGMRLLRDGKCAVEAVEQAVKSLEDKEITNAGFGSNLCIDGTVECDATIVDHLGRSGACGAVPNIKNPVSLAKIILEKSNEPLSLRRVPPNLLIGEGAKDFAWESGMPIVPNECLISKNARDRFAKWQEDLKRAEGLDMVTPVSWGGTDRTANSDTGSEMTAPSEAQRDHTNAILTGMWNEGQPDSPASPALSTPAHSRSPMPAPSPLISSSAAINSTSISPCSSRPPPERSPLSLLGSAFSPHKGRSREPGSPVAKRMRVADAPSGKPDSTAAGSRDGHITGPNDGDESEHVSDRMGSPPRRLLHFNRPSMEGGSHDYHAQELLEIDEDRITDTVGAIAIDREGRIAAASSSGGIGMKHRGRIGPAALVGIGTAVIPVNPNDPEAVTIATVTSGTGEHMATTMAAQKCAERLYHGTVCGAGGVDVEEQDESAILEGFIVNDFQEHPGVKNSLSAPAIGVMAVKKTPTRCYLYFAHNTDSFALASMGSKDREPGCVMSRVVNEGSQSAIAQGARRICLD